MKGQNLLKLTSLKVDSESGLKIWPLIDLTTINKLDLSNAGFRMVLPAKAKETEGFISLKRLALSDRFCCKSRDAQDEFWASLPDYLVLDEIKVFVDLFWRIKLHTVTSFNFSKHAKTTWCELNDSLIRNEYNSSEESDDSDDLPPLETC